jgi:hypothetical protein
MATPMSRLRRLTREGHRQLIEDMAMVLLDNFGEIELSDDIVCIVLLRVSKFHPGDIADCLDTARAMARQALTDEAGLWERLMR